MRTLKEIFEKENPQFSKTQILEYYIKYSDWIEAGLYKECTKKDKRISELMMEVKMLKNQIYMKKRKEMDIHSLRLNFEKEKGITNHEQIPDLKIPFYREYIDWLEEGISKEYATRDRLILELLKEVKDLKTKISSK